METGCLQVLTTVGGRETAEGLASHLVEARLAACAQVLGPITSTYRWRDQVERAAEWLVVAKTTAAAYPDLERALVERHPYELPEVTAVPITAGHPAYLDWIRRETGPA